MKTRGFEIVQLYLEKDIFLPKRNTSHSAGYDLEAAETVIISPGEIIPCPTGLKAYMQDSEVLQIYPRSSLAVKKHLILINSVGIIDKDYYNNESNEGHIQVLLYNYGKEPVTIQKHERVAQGIFMTFLKADNEPNQHVKRLGGFGSTGN
jgi:dUTP pyrophosphatase